MKLYIAGPMRGKPQFNFPAFDAKAEGLRKLGHEPVSPADLDREMGFNPASSPWSDDWLPEVIQRDINALADCDGVVLLDGWENSSGTQLEIMAARMLDIPIMDSHLRPLELTVITGRGWFGVALTLMENAA